VVHHQQIQVEEPVAEVELVEQAEALVLEVMLVVELAVLV
tara:strand:- start:154 stop:273 length:120 start_codon:yes stop_codon:yes gene_type:complete